MDNVELLLEMSYKNWEQARHLENQRAAITNMVLVLATAILDYVAEKGLSISVLPVTIALIAIGLYGALASEKLYERNQFHHAASTFSSQTSL